MIQDGCAACQASADETVELRQLLLAAALAAAEAREDARRLEAAAAAVAAAAAGGEEGAAAVARQRAAEMDMAAKSYRWGQILRACQPVEDDSELARLVNDSMMAQQLLHRSKAYCLYCLRFQLVTRYTAADAYSTVAPRYWSHSYPADDWCWKFV